MNEEIGFMEEQGVQVENKKTISGSRFFKMLKRKQASQTNIKILINMLHHYLP